MGWLGEDHQFPVGQVSIKFITIIQKLCSQPVMLHRGFHCCEFCDNATGNGQICVRHPNGNWYSAPTMLHHYVTVHHYLPPEEFIEAVLNPIEVMKPE